MEAKTHGMLWSGRFKEAPSEDALLFETSITVDKRLYKVDIKGSIAHTKMLQKIKIVTDSEAALIIKTLEEIERDIDSGTLPIDNYAEDVHSFIENTLTKRIGDIGKKVHTGRSRNDQIALDTRLYLKEEIERVKECLLDLVKTLVGIATFNIDTLLPGYTHTRQAQPISLAFQFCSYSYALVRDYQRLCDVKKRVDTSPIGSGAIAGSTLPLDREFEAKLLGFSAITSNSMDSISSRDYIIEVTMCLSLIQLNLSRIAEDLILWQTSEFNFIELSESYSTGSSLMPQKKNPDFLELIRGRTGKVYGALFNLLTMMKGLPSSYNRDMQEDKEALFTALDTVLSNLSVLKSVIETTTFNKEVMEEDAKKGFLNATDLADYLVKKGLPFRDSHKMAASFVRYAIENKTTLEAIPLDIYQKECALIEKDLYEAIRISACMNNRVTAGGTGRESVIKQIEELKEFISKEEEGKK